MCGIVGVAQHKEAVKIAFLALYALQHRGEEAVGIGAFDGKEMHTLKHPGLVADAFSEDMIRDLKGSAAIGHTRYSTTGSSNKRNIQPFFVTYKGKPIAVAHNGNLTNIAQLHKRLEEEGSIFQTTMDSEIIVHLLVRTKNGDLKEWIKEVLLQLEGAFSLVFLIGDVVVGARDPHGFRPLCLGKLEQGGYILASESCALDLTGAQFIREVEPGEVIFIYKDKMESVYLGNRKTQPKAHCIFENIYFARPDSYLFGDTVYEVRKRLGAQLAREYPAQADLVMAIPDSGSYAALGYAQELELPYEIGMIRNHYIGRTFIQPTQFIRDFRVKVKLNPIRSVLKGKRIIVVEDSIVRGTTSRGRIEELRRAGAKEIHMRISCPPIKSPCFYGIDFPSKKELIAHNKSVSEIAKFIHVDSLAYLSLEGMLSVMKDSGHFCHACFSGRYPVSVAKKQNKYILESRMTNK